MVNSTEPEPIEQRSEQDAHDEESPLLARSETPKVKPVTGVATIIAVLLLGRTDYRCIPTKETKY